MWFIPRLNSHLGNFCACSRPAGNKKQEGRPIDKGKSIVWGESAAIVLVACWGVIGDIHLNKWCPHHPGSLLGMNPILPFMSLCPYVEPLSACYILIPLEWIQYNPILPLMPLWNEFIWTPFWPWYPYLLELNTFEPLLPVVSLFTGVEISWVPFCPLCPFPLGFNSFEPLLLLASLFTGVEYSWPPFFHVFILLRVEFPFFQILLRCFGIWFALSTFLSKLP